MICAFFPSKLPSEDPPCWADPGFAARGGSIHLAGWRELISWEKTMVKPHDILGETGKTIGKP